MTITRVSRIRHHTQFHLYQLLFVAAVVSIGGLISTLPLELGICVSLAVAVGLVLLRWPWLIWPAFAFALPVTSGLRLSYTSLTEPVLVLAILFWFLNGVRQRSVRLHHTPLLVPLALFGLALTVSALGASDLGEAASEVVKWIEFGVVLALVPVMLPPQRSGWLVAAMILAGVMQAVLGLYQATYRIGPDWFVISGWLMRASGSFRQPNPYAGYLGLVLPVALSLAIYGWHEIVFNQDRRFVTWIWSSFCLSSALLIGAGLVASWSRGGWIGATASIFLVFVLWGRRAAMVFGLACAAVTVVVLMVSLDPDPLEHNIAIHLPDLPAFLSPSNTMTKEVTDDNFSVIERIAHWVAALRMWETDPWLGIGTGNYATVYPKFRMALWEEPLGHAHNVYLNVLAENGIVGLGAFLSFWTVVTVWTWRKIGGQSLRTSSSSQLWGSAVAIGVLGIIGHLAVHNLFDNLFVQGMYLQVALWLAILATSDTGPGRAVADR